MASNIALVLAGLWAGAAIIMGGIAIRYCWTGTFPAWLAQRDPDDPSL